MLYEYLNNDDLESIWDLDNRITVQTIAIESRNGGKLVASRMIKLFMDLYDSDLLNINPRDQNLNLYYKRKVLAECMRNFW